MPFYTYIIQSDTDGSFYIGSTHDLELRVLRHNEGWSRSTKAKRPWNLVYFKEFQTKSEALKREFEIKRRKSKKYIESLIKNA
ncbi:MAG: GIY-YIG nuclease family protein [Bacteroidota bacterium]